MTNYSNGKIYKIECLTTGLIYVGSTTKKYLSERLTAHRGNFNSYKKGITTAYMTSFKILENDNYRIDLIEAVNCNSKDELRAREGYHIRTLECVNKKIEGRTDKEYYLDNKEKLSENAKEYYLENKEKILKRTDDYRKNNKEIISLQKKEKFTCECGGKFTNSGRSKHKLTKKHQDFLTTI
jgi:hypothetical protein